MTELEVIDWGRTGYGEAFEKQKDRVDLRKVGRRAQPECENPRAGHRYTDQPAGGQFV